MKIILQMEEKNAFQSGLEGVFRVLTTNYKD